MGRWIDNIRGLIVGVGIKEDRSNKVVILRRMMGDIDCCRGIVVYWFNLVEGYDDVIMIFIGCCRVLLCLEWI